MKVKKLIEILNTIGKNKNVNFLFYGFCTNKISKVIVDGKNVIFADNENGKEYLKNNKSAKLIKIDKSKHASISTLQKDLTKLKEIIKQLENTIEYFENAQTDFQKGRLFEAKQILQTLSIHNVDSQKEAPKSLLQAFDNFYNNWICEIKSIQKKDNEI